MKNNMQHLLNKYFLGKTTLQEEAELKRYFQSGKVEKAHLPYQILFQYFAKEKANILTNDFDKQMVAKLPTKGKVVKMQSFANRLTKIAAMLLVLIFAWLVTKNTLTPPPQTMEERWATHEINDPEQAFDVTKAALIFASKKWNRGTTKAANGVEKIQKVSKYFKNEK